MAEDNAIEDTIYHLHRALNAGRIDLDRFLRVRLSFSFKIGLSYTLYLYLYFWSPVYARSESLI